MAARQSSPNTGESYRWVILGLGNALVPAAVFAFPPRIVAPRHMGVGYSFVLTCSNLGIVVGPYVTGMARDATGSYQYSFYLMVFFALLIGVSAATLALVKSRPHTREISP